MCRAMLIVEFILDLQAVWREYLVPDFCSRLQVESFVLYEALKDVFSCVEMPSSSLVTASQSKTWSSKIWPRGDCIICLSGSTLDVISVTSLLASRVPCWCYGELREETNTRITLQASGSGAVSCSCQSVLGGGQKIQFVLGYRPVCSWVIDEDSEHHWDYVLALSKAVHVTDHLQC